MNQYAIGIDIGGTNIRVALVDKQLNVLKKESIETTAIKTLEDFIKVLHQLIRKVDANKLAAKIGMIVPIPWKNGMTHFKDAVNVPFLEGVAIEDIRRKFPDHSLFFENDVSVVALLESQAFSEKSLENLIYITVSTGIGSGIVINGEIWQGAQGYAGEVGNMIVSNIEAKKAVTLEELCSGSALDKVSAKVYGEGKTAKELFEAFKRQEKTAVEIIEPRIDILSDALASIMHMLNPDVFIFGGSVILNNPWLLELLKEKTRPKLLKHLRESLKVELTHYGGDSGILGSAQLCF